MTTVELTLPDPVAEKLISMGTSAGEMIDQALRDKEVEYAAMAVSRWEITFDRYLELTGKVRAQNMILAKRRFEHGGETEDASWEFAVRVAELRPGTAVSDEGPLLNLGRVGLAGLIPRLFQEVWLSDGVLLKHIRPGTNFGPPGSFAAYDLIESVSWNIRPMHLRIIISFAMGCSSVLLAFCAPHSSGGIVEFKFHSDHIGDSAITYLQVVQ